MLHIHFKQASTKVNMLRLRSAAFSWIPDGKERNDYQHKEFVPFDY